MATARRSMRRSFKNISKAGDGVDLSLEAAKNTQWDGGSTGLVAATGRTSLGLGTAAVTAATAYATAAQGLKADVVTREGASTGAKVVLAEGTDNGTNTVTIQAPAAITSNRSITVPDADVTLANIAVSVAKVNDILTYLNNGVLAVGTLAISGADAVKFKTTSTAIYVIGGAAYAKVATDELTFTAAHVITASKFGIVLVQINAAGTVSTKVPASPQAYDSAPLALAALPAVDASNVALGYIAIENNAGDWTANTDDLTNASDVTTASFVTTAARTVPAAIA